MHVAYSPFFIDLQHDFDKRISMKKSCAIKNFKRDTNFSNEPLKLAIEEFILDLTQMRSQRKHRITFFSIVYIGPSRFAKVKQNLHLSLWIIVDFTKFIIQEGNIINFLRSLVKTFVQSSIMML